VISFSLYLLFFLLSLQLGEQPRAVLKKATKHAMFTMNVLERCVAKATVTTAPVNKLRIASPPPATPPSQGSILGVKRRGAAAIPLVGPPYTKKTVTMFFFVK
jgi:hypothetical protein